MAAAMAENEKCIGGFVGVLCVVLRGTAENNLVGTINDTIF
jgi:hypothetical protein